MKREDRGRKVGEGGRGREGNEKREWEGSYLLTPRCLTSHPIPPPAQHANWLLVLVFKFSDSSDAILLS